MLTLEGQVLSPELRSCSPGSALAGVMGLSILTGQQAAVKMVTFWWKYCFLKERALEQLWEAAGCLCCRAGAGRGHCQRALGHPTCSAAHCSSAAQCTGFSYIQQAASCAGYFYLNLLIH